MSLLSGARILVTGGRGFTGIHFRQELERQNCTFFGLVESRPGPGDLTADLNDLEALKAVVAQARPDFVVHLAGISNVVHENELEYYRVNVLGTTNLLKALIQENVQPRRVLIASSANVYGNAPVSPVAETAIPAPVNHYAMSKLAMEHMVRTWSDRIPLVITRPFNYTGPGQLENFLIPKIVAHFKRRDSEIRLGNLDVEREFNDVRMVVQAYLGLLSGVESADTVNICSGRGHTMMEVLGLAKKLTGHDLRVVVDPKFVRPTELKTLVGDPSKLHALVPGLPSFTLKETLEWMLRT